MGNNNSSRSITAIDKASMELLQSKRHAKSLELTCGRPYSTFLATAIRDRLLLVDKKVRWDLIVHTIECEEDNGYEILSEAFQNARIDDIWLIDVDGSTQAGRRTIHTVFRSKSHERTMNDEENTINFVSCKLEYLHAYSLKNYLERFQHDVRLNFYSCFFSDGENFANFFQTLQEADGHHSVARSIGLYESELANEESFRFGVILLNPTVKICMESFPSLVGTPFLLSLKKLEELEITHTFDQTLTLSSCGLISLLNDEDCRLKHLSLQNSIIDDMSLLTLFKALKQNTSLERLDLKNVDRNVLTDDALADMLALPSRLKWIGFGNENQLEPSDDMIDKICTALQTVNPHLEGFEYPWEDKWWPYEITPNKMKPYLARNRAGRRLLMQEQSIPAGLWPQVLARWLPEVNRASFSDVCCGWDAIYHLMREKILVEA